MFHSRYRPRPCFGTHFNDPLGTLRDAITTETAIDLHRVVAANKQRQKEILAKAEKKESDSFEQMLESLTATNEVVYL